MSNVLRFPLNRPASRVFTAMEVRQDLLAIANHLDAIAHLTPSIPWTHCVAAEARRIVKLMR